MTPTHQPQTRVAIVTGASGGIGAAIARRLAADGDAVIVHYAGGVDHANDVVKHVIDHGGRAVAVHGDISDADDMTALFDAAAAEFGGVDVVANTAGIMPLAPVASMDLDTFDLVQRINVRGTFIVSQLAAQRLRPGGALINTSSSMTRTRSPNYGAYAASKAAVEALTLVLARELRGRDITVNTIAPGPTATPLFMAGKSDELVQQIASANPFDRLGTPDDIASVAAFLAGPGRWVNGQVLFVNGGFA